MGIAGCGWTTKGTTWPNGCAGTASPPLFSSIDWRAGAGFIALANALKLRGYDFHFRFGTSLHAIAQGALDLPESLAWLWRDYDRSKTMQTYETEEAERANRDAW